MGNDRGGRLQGDGAPSLGVAHGLSADVAFGSITNVDRGTAHSTQTVLFAKVPIAFRGTFGNGLAGNPIQGGWCDPEHLEAARIFEQANMVEEFGAKKPSLESRGENAVRTGLARHIGNERAGRGRLPRGTDDPAVRLLPVLPACQLQRGSRSRGAGLQRASRVRGGPSDGP
ncbi:MAG: hypothetical protein OYH76_00460 [Defluviicoccus sp.]|nr:hypothetical protein [Defluviicoccus sp.]MDE0274335.1 hypothetical protein [Defluviicoccus sp.]